MAHTKFTSVESFAHVYRGQKRFLDPEFALDPYKIRYAAKIKLHGTNAAIRIDPGNTVTAQGRNRDLSVTDDQFGFAQWVADSADLWQDYAQDLRDDFYHNMDVDAEGFPVIVHGEWAGCGIQKNDAVTKLNDKFFFVFAVQIGGEMILEPQFIEELIPDLCQLLVLPWHVVCDDTIDYADSAQCAMFADWVSSYAEEIGKKDPFIAEIFEIEGPGEGLVFVPYAGHVRVDKYNTTIFKAKTANHNVKKGKPAARDLVIPQSVLDFVDLFITDARCEQGLSEACGGVAETQLTSDFLKWMGQDVKKESVAELEDSGMAWKDVSSHVTKAARNWFLSKCKGIS